MNGWYARQLDFVLAFAHAKVERELPREIQKGIHIEEFALKNRMGCIFQILSNLCGQTRLQLGFKISEVDDRMFYYKKSILLIG